MTAGSISRADAARELLARRQAHASVLEFACLTHHNFIIGEHHRKICDALMQVEAGEIDRLMVFMPPRHGKSELISVRFPAWFLGRNNRKQIISVSYSDELASDFGRQVRNLVDSEDYKRVFPDVELQADSKAANRWHTSNGGSYLATSVGGSITGKGADLLALDDTTKNKEESDNERARNRIWNAWQSDMQTRLMPGGAVIIVNTRWHQDDLCGRLLEHSKQSGETWHVLSLPAILNEGTDQEQALWPEWYDLDSMRRRRSNMLLRDWSALYQQEPTPADGEFFKRDWFQRFEQGSAPQGLSVYITTDFAVSAGKGDYTEFAVWGLDRDDNVWALDWWYGQTTADVWVEQLLHRVRMWQPLAVFGEGGVIRRSVEPFLLKRMRETSNYARLVWLNSTQSKTARASVARGFQARAAMSKVWFPRTNWADRVIEQCIGFPAAKHDDAVDCCSQFGQALLAAQAPRPTSDEVETKDGDDAWARAFRRDPLGDGVDFWRIC